MAEIEMERRPRRSAWTWIILLLVLAAVAFGAWLVFGGDVEVGSEPAGEVPAAVAEPVTEPATPLRERPARESGEAPAAEPAEGPGVRSS